MKKKIYYYDTDAGGIVYYANYLKYIEEARTEFFASRGISIQELAKTGILFVVARQEIDYKYPVYYGDILEITTRLADISSACLSFEHEIKNQDGKLTTKAKTMLVCVGHDLKPRIIPEDIRKAIS
ncbi:MAG: acyl-CoA thioesterase [Candidatus Omnitrophica bacterium]|nr:acyl-CoA thioesterase [Candidatus Omnitrophota bacterium]